MAPQLDRSHLILIAKTLSKIPCIQGEELISIYKSTASSGSIHLSDTLFFSLFTPDEYTTHPSPHHRFSKVCVTFLKEAPEVEIFCLTNSTTIIGRKFQ